MAAVPSHEHSVSRPGGESAALNLIQFKGAKRGKKKVEVSVYDEYETILQTMKKK